ncbi:GNAT family N-acetyltransferase [Noviherbaspirillum galbum]|uniref:GNAT family N-acetyltransferase n=1 Tax=Noviherbaspirillum galbum TaxID=2709383 RepID=A0A6B3SPG1_9BURK|nr:GNAT family protein [Noviherbaspirillum galbum]NEX61185.1 GNAT family N-acetyltransferase [Noviherbaspirillum galbum]
MSANVPIAPVTLSGSLVRLEPLSMHHLADLRAAAADGELWKLWYTSVPHPDKMEAEIERRLGLQEKGSMLPFTIRRQDTGAICGMTTYMNIDAVNMRVEIGSTWYARSAQRTGINTEAKLLLLQYAFEALRCIAVEFRTHWVNRQSRAAIERLGAKQDGVLRNHIRMPDGTLRDTVVYSIIESEWPTIKRHLQYLLSRMEPASC